MVSHPPRLTSGEHRCPLAFTPSLPPVCCSRLPPQLWGRQGGGRERPLTGGAGAEPMGGLQVLDASRVLAGDVDGGGLGRWCVKPGLTGGLSV